MASVGSTHSGEDISDLIALDKQSPDHFVSKSFPERTGNTLRIAYGGCTLAVVVQAACKTVAPQYQLYCCLGSFLRPTSIDHKIQCRVVRTRDTKSFASRVVHAFQILDDGSERVRAHTTLDFHVPEVALFEYSVRPPAVEGQSLEDEQHALSPRALLTQGVATGTIRRADADKYFEGFHLMERYFDWRHCATSMSFQTMLGMATHVPTSHDHRHITERPQVEWIRLRRPLGSRSENLAALAFYMDGGLSFLPLHLDHKTLDDVEVCSTLDFAVRVIAPDVDFAEWHLRERKTMAAAGGRTLSESWLWDRRGNVVAMMSQTSIMRAPRGQWERGKL